MANSYIKKTEGSLPGGLEYHILNTLEFILRIDTGDMDEKEKLSYHVAVEIFDGGKFDDAAFKYSSENNVVAWVFIQFKSTTSLKPVICESHVFAPETFSIKEEFSFAIYYFSAVRTLNIKNSESNDPRYAVTNFILHTNRQLAGDLHQYFEEDDEDSGNWSLLTGGRGKVPQLASRSVHWQRPIQIHFLLPAVAADQQISKPGRLGFDRVDLDS